MKTKIRSLDQIKADAQNRFDQNKGVRGQVTRADILEALENFASPEKEKENIGKFLDELGFVSMEEKRKILDDLDSYQVSYKR